MKKSTASDELIKTIYRIYCELEESHRTTIKSVKEILVPEEEIREAYNDVVERLNIKLQNGKCSQLFLNQLARHHCNIGERFGERVEIYSSRDIIDIVELLEEGKYPARQFKRSNSLIKGLWKAHHNGRSQFYSYTKNIKQYWFQSNGKLKRDISGIVNKYPQDLKAILTEMQYQALNEKHKNHEMTGEWIVFAKHNNTNYYLCLAIHESGENDVDIYNILESSFDEFPELKQIVR